MGLPVITMSIAEEVVRLTFNEGEKRPLFFLGKGGIGKSEIIENLAKKELGIGYIDIRLLLYTETDIKGIPYPDNEKRFTIWLQNDILPRVEKHGKEGILVFDEITSSMKSVRTAIYQLLNERRLGEYILPDGWMVICLGNGEEDGGDYNGMEGNFANRCSLFRVKCDIVSFKKYGMQSGINPMVLAYLNWCTEDLHTYDDTQSSEESLLFASPRSWKAVSDLLNRKNGDIDNITELRIKSNIGTMVGEKFISFSKFKDKAVDIHEILDGKTKKIPKDKEAVFLTIQNLVGEMSKMVDTDYNNNGTASIKTLASCSNGIRWLLSLNVMENAVMGIKDFISSGKKNVVNMLMSDTFDEYCPEFEEFATKHAEMLK